MTASRNDPLSGDERAALNDLVPSDRQTGYIVDDLASAARAACARRVLAAVQEGVVLDALHRELQLWRDAEARRWAGVSLPLLPP